MINEAHIHVKKVLLLNTRYTSIYMSMHVHTTLPVFVVICLLQDILMCILVSLDVEPKVKFMLNERDYVIPGCDDVYCDYSIVKQVIA